jgi:hypothetical protein
MALKSSAFLETIIAFLLPYFTNAARDIHDARSEIIDTLESYATRTRAELLQVAQIIAFGMTTLDILSEAKTTEMSMSMRIRFRGCANGLNRSTIQLEKALDRRLACDVPTAPELMREPINDVPDAQVQATIEQAQAKIDTTRNHLSSARPASQEERNKQLWAGAMVDTLKQMGITVQTVPDGGQTPNP